MGCTNKITFEEPLKLSIFLMTLGSEGSEEIQWGKSFFSPLAIIAPGPSLGDSSCSFIDLTENRMIPMECITYWKENNHWYVGLFSWHWNYRNTKGQTLTRWTLWCQGSFALFILQKSDKVEDQLGISVTKRQKGTPYLSLTHFKYCRLLVCPNSILLVQVW